MEKQILYILKNTDPLLKVTMFANSCKGRDKVVKLWTQSALLSNFRLVQQILDLRLKNISYPVLAFNSISQQGGLVPKDLETLVSFQVVQNRRSGYSHPPLKDRNRKL